MRLVALTAARVSRALVAGSVGRPDPGRAPPRSGSAAPVASRAASQEDAAARRMAARLASLGRLRFALEAASSKRRFRAYASGLFAFRLA